MRPGALVSCSLLLACCAAVGPRERSVRRAQWLEARSRWVEAGELWHELTRRDPGDAEAERGLARALEAQGEPEGALALLARAAREHPDDARVRHDHGQALARRGRWEEALAEEQAAARAAARAGWSWAEPERAAGALGLRLARGDEARAAYGRLCALAPDDPGAWSGAARAHALCGDPEQALLAWEAAFARGGFEVPSALEAARLARTREAWWERADRWLDRVRREAPQEPLGHRLAGEIALALGREGDALVALRRALEIEPDDLDTLLKLADLHLRRGEPEAVAQLVEHARAVGGDAVAGALEARIRRAP